MKVIFNCWHCQRLNDEKNYSKHRLNSGVTQALTVVNGNNARGGSGDESRASPSIASMREYTFKPIKTKSSSVTLLDTANV
jgi:hypothetical protein